jgi:hypothetical protein
MRDITLPIENLVVGRFHGVQCESQLDKWLDATRQQVIVELVCFGLVVDVLAVFHSHRSHYVVEDRIETNVAEAEFIDRSLELRLAVVANEWRDAGAGAAGEVIVRNIRQQEAKPV